MQTESHSASATLKAYTEWRVCSTSFQQFANLWILSNQMSPLPFSVSHLLTRLSSLGYLLMHPVGFVRCASTLRSFRQTYRPNRSGQAAYHPGHVFIAPGTSVNGVMCSSMWLYVAARDVGVGRYPVQTNSLQEMVEEGRKATRIRQGSFVFLL